MNIVVERLLKMREEILESIKYHQDQGIANAYKDINLFMERKAENLKKINEIDRALYILDAADK